MIFYPRYEDLLSGHALRRIKPDAKRGRTLDFHRRPRSTVLLSITRSPASG